MGYVYNIYTCALASVLAFIYREEKKEEDQGINCFGW
jgi:hypothetical protein